MTDNPTINELTESGNFELVTTLGHSNIKEFVFGQISKRSGLTIVYMAYQLIMVLTGVLFLGYAVYIAFHGNFDMLSYSVIALVFSFSALVILHELMHGIALKLTGASKINYGGNLKKFIFYAEADMHVINRNQFYFIALTPLVLVKIISFAGIIVFHAHPLLFFFVILMCLHSLFCAGDIGLMSFFSSHNKSDIYTFDNHSERKSYFFKRISDRD